MADARLLSKPGIGFADVDVGVGFGEPSAELGVLVPLWLWLWRECIVALTSSILMRSLSQG